jgi:hypothetical protein
MSNLHTYADGEPFAGVIGRASDESMDSLLGRDFFTVVSDVKAPAGNVSLRYDTVPNISSTEGMTCGHDGDSRVAPEHYRDKRRLHRHPQAGGHRPLRRSHGRQGHRHEGRHGAAMMGSRTDLDKHGYRGPTTDA